jgi:hypothetical protein
VYLPIGMRAAPSRVVLYRATGRVIESVMMHRSQPTVVLPCGTLPPGQYFVTVGDGEQRLRAARPFLWMR